MLRSVLTITFSAGLSFAVGVSICCLRLPLMWWHGAMLNLACISVCVDIIQ